MDGQGGTRASWSTEEDGSLLLAAIKEKNKDEPSNITISTSIFGLNEPGNRASLRKTLVQLLDIIDNKPEVTHLALEVHANQNEG